VSLRFELIRASAFWYAVFAPSAAVAYVSAPGIGAS
jgi:hypothetical protein